MYVSVAVVRAVLGELTRQGISSDEMLPLCGLSPERLEDPSGQVSIAEYTKVIEEALARSSTPAFGLKAGAHAPTGAAHVLGFIIVNSRTLRDAIRAFRKYSTLVMEEAEWTFVEQDDEATFGFLHPHVSGAVARCEAEMLVSFMIARIGLHFLGPTSRLREVRFVHEAPAWTEAYEAFGCRVVFGAARNEIVFDAKYLDVAQLHCDTAFCQLLCDRADRLLGERRSDDRLRDRVKDVLKYQLPLGQVQADDVAKALRITPRTLRRKLGLLGCNLRELFDEARKELACDAMRRPEQPIKDLAYDLGFAEPSAFHRAFKRWTGTTPQQFRAGDTIPLDGRVGSRARRHDAMRTASAPLLAAGVAVSSRAMDRMASSSLSRSA